MATASAGSRSAFVALLSVPEEPADAAVTDAQGLTHIVRKQIQS